ncbi:hypothetical protein P7C73_g6769, partial [Tremellales sp. Uapishka_1]
MTSQTMIASKPLSAESSTEYTKQEWTWTVRFNELSPPHRSLTIAKKTALDVRICPQVLLRLCKDHFPGYEGRWPNGTYRINVEGETKTVEMVMVESGADYGKVLAMLPLDPAKAFPLSEAEFFTRASQEDGEMITKFREEGWQTDFKGAQPNIDK